MKKLLLLSLLATSGIFSAENRLTRYRQLQGNSSTKLFLDQQETDYTLEDFNYLIQRQEETSQIINNYNGYSGWSLVGCFAGGVVVTLGTLGALAYLGYNHIRPDLTRGLNMVQAIGEAVGKAKQA